MAGNHLPANFSPFLPHGYSVQEVIWMLQDIFHDALPIYMEKQADNTLNIHYYPQAYIAGIARILWIKNKGDHHVVSLDTMNDGDWYTGRILSIS